MSVWSLRGIALLLGIATMIAARAGAEDLKGEIAPSGKLRVGIGISAAGGAYWSNKTESGGYVGVPVDLGKEMAAELGVPVEYVPYSNSGQITDAASKGAWDVTFLPQDPERETKMSFGPIYEVADATYIVKAGSSITNFATLDQPGIKVAAVNNTTTMRGAQAHLKNAEVTGYQTFDEIFALLKNGEVDAFAVARSTRQVGPQNPRHEGAGRDLQEDRYRGRGSPQPSAVACVRHQIHDRRPHQRNPAQGL